MKKIILMTTLFSLFGFQVFADENKILKTNTVEKTEKVQKIISKKVELQEKKDGVEKKTQDDALFESLLKAKNEEERQKILKEYKKEKFEEKATKEIFDNFDFILNKLEVVSQKISVDTKELKEKGVDVKFLETKNLEYQTHYFSAKREEVLAWLKIQKIDFNNDTETILVKLADVKNNLVKSKIEIRTDFSILKEMISYTKGAQSVLIK
jgi:hypothetical protein